MSWPLGPGWDLPRALSTLICKYKFYETFCEWKNRCKGIKMVEKSKKKCQIKNQVEKTEKKTVEGPWAKVEGVEYKLYPCRTLF